MCIASTPLVTNSYNFLQFVPLVTPALKKDSYEIDGSLLNWRIGVVASAALAVLVATAIAAPAFIPVIAHLIIVSPVIPLLDGLIAKRAADVKAVDDFLNDPKASISTIVHISKSLNAAKLLINRDGDLNKIVDRLRLLDNAYNLPVFKLLIDNGADIKALDRYGTCYFQHCIRDSNTARLEYILKSNKIKPENFTSTQQVNFWQNLGCRKSADLLINHGFDVNSKDDEGYTALLRIVKDPFSMNYSNLSVAESIKVLLDCGANPLISVEEEGIQKNAIQMNTDPEINAIFQKLDLSV